MKQKGFFIKHFIVTIILFITLFFNFQKVQANPYKGGNSNCTYTAWQMCYEATGHQLPAWSHAATWLDSARNTGYTTSLTPRENSVAVWYDGGMGHVAWVTSVSGNQIYVKEGGYYGAYHEGWVPASGYRYGNQYIAGYIYIGETNSDIYGPSYSDFHVGEIWSGGFTVMANVTDNSGISQVRYAVWTDANGQDDLIWYDGHNTDNNNYYWARINFSEHNNSKGNYIIHMYSYDSFGNCTSTGISYVFDSEGPKYEDFHVGELREGAFTVMAKITDSSGVSNVKYAVWSDLNGQDDLIWYTGNHTDNNNYYWARINFSEHNNERGKYTIHLYAYDSSGQCTQAGLTYVFDEKGPMITDISVFDVSTSGYTISCKVKDDSLNVLRVQFPTWTLFNNQDDIAKDWQVNSAVKGKKEGDIWTFRVNSNAHNNETGTYITHIYAYDTLGNSTSVAVPFVNVHNHNWGNGVISKKPTENETGELAYICSICNETRTEVIEKLTSTSQSTIPSKHNNSQTKKTVISTPQIKGINGKRKCIKITWHKIKKINGYIIQYSRKRNFKKHKTITIKKASNCSKFIKNLKSKKRYFVRIRAYKINSGKKYYSTWSKCKSKKTK